MINIEESGFECVDLFSGAGGFAEGFRQAGWRIAGANDIDPFAAKTFSENFPDSTFVNAPISEVNASGLYDRKPGALDCLIGGPPCQSFSFNNHHRSASDDRARLFLDYLRLVDDLRPKTLVMENVPGMLSIQNGQVVEDIRRALSELGYSTHCTILKAEQFGVPQLRRRVFIFGSRVASPNSLVPAATHWNKRFNRVEEKPSSQKVKRTVNVRSAIGDLPRLRNGEGQPVSQYGDTSPTTEFQRYARSGARILYNHHGHRLGEVNLQRASHIPAGGNWLSIPRELLPAGMKRAKLSDHTKRYGRLSWDGYASTILTKCDPHWGCYLHPEENRVITVREAARFQGFPDTFRFFGDSLTAQYKQVGNAVPVLLALSVAKSISAHLQSIAGPKQLAA